MNPDPVMTIEPTPPALVDGDTAFIGVDERGDPSQTRPGYVTRATNKRFRDGIAADRLGIVIAPWGKTDGITPFTDLHGIGVFSDPNGVEWILIAAEGKVWRTRPNNTAIEVPLPAGVTLTGRVRFTQTYYTVLLARGFEDAPLQMTSLDTGFESITQVASDPNSGDGTLEIPPFLYGETVQNRLVLAGAMDRGYVSDAQNYTRYALPNALRINEGSDDTLIRFGVLGRSTLVAFKDESVYPIHGFSADASGTYIQAVLGEQIKTHGLKAGGSVVKLPGGDLWYLSTKGIASLRLTAENEIRGVDVPVSDRLRETMKRVNWPAAGNAVAAADNENFLYFAVPRDDAKVRGDELIPEGATYTGTGYTLTGLTAGARYEFTQGASEVSCTNGAEVLTGDAIFTAAGTSVTLTANSSGAAVTASVVPVLHEDVNNGVLVFDQENNEWAGTDESRHLAVFDFFLFTVDGRKRLFFLGADGLLHMYNEGFEDEVLAEVETPYTDLLVNALPAPGNTVQVNGGTLVTAIAASANSGTDWGADTVANARANLWSGGSKGYDPALASPWTAPNTTPSQCDYGVRFTATNGALPTIATAGAWAFADPHSGVEITPVPIESSWTTRGYLCGRQQRKRFETARLLLSTWAPRVSVTVTVDGIEEVDDVTSAPLTRSRTRYTTWNTPDWDSTNVNDDHGNRLREDYSVVPDAAGIVLGSGVAWDAHQEAEEPYHVGRAGRFCQFTFTNTSGRCDVRGLAVSGQPLDAEVHSHH